MFPFDFEKPKTAGEWIFSIAASGLVLTSPYGGKAVVGMVKEYLEKQKKIKRDLLNSGNLSQAIYYYKKNKLIKVNHLEGGKIEIILTEKGEKRRLTYAWENMKVKKPNKWDWRWRIVMFDFPNNDSGFRDAFRNKLKQLGLFQFQKSVWIYPYECKDEVDFVAETLGVAKYITFITATIDSDEILREKFDI